MDPVKPAKTKHQSDLHIPQKKIKTKEEQKVDTVATPAITASGPTSHSSSASKQTHAVKPTNAVNQPAKNEKDESKVAKSAAKVGAAASSSTLSSSSSSSSKPNAPAAETATPMSIDPTSDDAERALAYERAYAEAISNNYYLPSFLALVKTVKPGQSLPPRT